MLLQCLLGLVPVLAGGSGVVGDGLLYGGSCGHREAVLLLLGPGRPFEFDQFVGEFDISYRPDRTTRPAIGR
ncbi:hypothetical protein ACIGJO_19095 [Streptomyces sp. NPDC079020]|uniref:hypothetical protein n=1 Tax=Streptomyces sp. NPDC079020 TaxID=3365722 RepID=UPI0037D61D9D